MSYKLGYTDRFKETLNDINREDRIRILKKIEWVAQNAEQLQHERLRNPPGGWLKCSFGNLTLSS